MEDFTKNLDALLATVTKLFNIKKNYPEIDILTNAAITLEETGYDNWDGGINLYTLYLRVSPETYSKYDDIIQDIEKTIHDKIIFITKPYEGNYIQKVLISPIITQDDAWRSRIIGKSVEDLLKDIDLQKNIMISVSTGGPLVKDKNQEYLERQKKINTSFKAMGLTNPIPFDDLWQWHGKWSSGDLPSYESRRKFIRELFDPLIKRLKLGPPKHGERIFDEPTGWARVDRTLSEIRTRLASASVEEQFQAVGLLCRNAIITLAQAVYDKSKHGDIDDVTTSKSDAKRMLEAYIAIEMSSSSNDYARKYAKASFDFANNLTHKRTANFNDAALCSEATASLINIIAIVSGRRS